MANNLCAKIDKRYIYFHNITKSNIMKNIFLLNLLFVFFIIVLSSCNKINSEQNEVFQSEFSNPCVINNHAVIENSKEQGNQISWSHDGKYISFVGPSPTTLRHVGTLYLADSPDFYDKLNIDERVVGGIVWSPDSSMIAYTKLREIDNIYTIMYYDINTNHKTDLFPGSNAETDEWSSPKIVTSWEDNNTLIIEAMCGVGCVEVTKTDIEDNSFTVINQIYKKSVWEITEEPINIEMIEPVMSTSNKISAFFDINGQVYLQSEESSQPTYLNQYQSVNFDVNDKWSYELDWWMDKYLAVRINDELTIYDVPCALSAK